MLIAAYAGCGKSTAAQELGPDVLDLPSMPYRWLLPQAGLGGRAGREMEREKGALHHIADPRFPHNYVLDILKAERAGKIVLFPTIVPVINMLVERYGRDVLVAYPEDGLKEEYRQRYLARGNSESFLDLFAAEWEARLEAIKGSKGRHLSLKSGEYLLAALSEELGCAPNRPQAVPVPQSELAELEREAAERGRDRVLWMYGLEGRRAACPVGDLDAAEVREALEAVGMAALERNLCSPRLVSKQWVLMYAREGGRFVWFKDLSDFYSRRALQEVNHFL